MRALHFILSLNLLVFAQTSPCHASNDLVFIVNAENSAEKISRETIRDYYLKNASHWPDGADVRFIDRAEGSELRKMFLANIIKKTPVDMGIYWIRQQTLTGNSAPLQEKTDLMTVQFVSMFKGAIGYVSASTAIKSKNVKIVRIDDENK